jgi:mono/diheme cytochrome c family protein
MISRSRFTRATLVAFVALVAGARLAGQNAANPSAAGLSNPVASTPQSIAAGKRAYDANCVGCHGNLAQGAVKAGVAISIIQEQGGKQPPDLTDAQWDHGSSDGEIFTVIKRGVPPSMMAGWEGRISDTEIWSIVHYLRALATNKDIASTPAAAAADRTAQHWLQVSDYAAMPITGELGGENTRAELARVNFLRDEPGGRRFFVNDLNGPLYILDKQTRQFTTYLDFNGLAGRPGLFPKLTFERNFATGLINFVFDPDYRRNGVFYTLHMEDPTTQGTADPKPGVVKGLDLTGYRTTAAIPMPVQPGAVINRETVLIEWTDRNPGNSTFEGTARELLRLQQASPIHPMGEMTFNPAAKSGDADWRVMYIGSGDAGTGEQKDIRRMNPQRLDTLAGKILRIVPDLREHVQTSTVSENGRYRIPSDNPFVAIDGARKEIWAVGLRNPHRLVWDFPATQSSEPKLLAFSIGLASWETVFVIRKGANYGYSLREGTQAMSLEGMGPVPADDTIPLRISDTVTRGTVKPVYPVIAYPHAGGGGDAIAGGFIYRGSRIPALKGKLVLGDITTGRIWYADMEDVLRADDGDARTIAPLHEVDAGIRGLVEATFRARGARGESLPGAAAVSGRGRVDLRFAEDNSGELYVLTKSDGMIRQIVGFK